MSVASLSLRVTGLYEAELLVELMLRYWSHPLAADADFRSDLLERAAEALRAAIAGQALIDGLPATKTNLVAAIWYAEWMSLGPENTELDPEIVSQCNNWLETVRRALPSCFCPPDLLP
jgi:hypothetical protein